MSGLPSSRSILDHFSALRDHREQWRVLYPLREVLLLVLCATLSGMEDFVEIRLWGQHRLDFLTVFCRLRTGYQPMTPLMMSLTGLIPSCSKPALRPGSRRCATRHPISSRLTARRRGVVTRGAKAARRCTWFQPGRRASGWCWVRKR